MKVTIGISAMAVSEMAEDVLVTYALGSCIGLTLFDPGPRIGGMVHCLLPLSKIDPVKAGDNPCMFVDTGVSALLQALFDRGAQRKNLIAKAAGGSRIMDEQGIFQIGERNYTVLRKILWKNNILIAGEDVGGSASRTLYLDMGTGRTTMRIGSRETEI